MGRAVVFLFSETHTYMYVEEARALRETKQTPNGVIIKSVCAVAILAHFPKLCTLASLTGPQEGALHRTEPAQQSVDITFNTTLESPKYCRLISGKVALR